MREQTRLKARLAVRERQFAVAVKTLKAITQFEHAPLSVFASEVERVKRLALDGLISMENLQRDKPLKIVPAKMTLGEHRVHARELLRDLIGTYDTAGADPDD